MMRTRLGYLWVEYLGLVLIAAGLLLSACVWNRWAYVKLTLFLAGAPQWHVTFDKGQEWVPEEFRNNIGLSGVVTSGHRVVAVVARYRQLDAHPFVATNAPLQARLERANSKCYRLVSSWWMPLALGLPLSLLGMWLDRRAGDEPRE